MNERTSLELDFWMADAESIAHSMELAAARIRRTLAQVDANRDKVRVADVKRVTRDVLEAASPLRSEQIALRAMDLIDTMRASGLA